jgi:hypothetical protein
MVNGGLRTHFTLTFNIKMTGPLNTVPIVLYILVTLPFFGIYSYNGGSDMKYLVNIFNVIAKVIGPLRNLAVHVNVEKRNICGVAMRG